MSDLKLVRDTPTPLEKLLIDASRAEQPSEEHKYRLRAALGLGAPLSALPPAPTSPAPPRVDASPLAGKPFGAAKVAALGAALVLAGAAFFIRAQGGSDSSVAAVVASSVVPPPVPVVEPAPEPAARLQPKSETPPLPSSEAQPSAPSLRGARSGAAPAADADLSEQIRLIEAARAGVAGRDAAKAMSALDTYGARFPRGAFGQEAAVLRIRAAEQSGDAARATALAKSFIARFPRSPHVARLKPIAERGASR